MMTFTSSYLALSKSLQRHLNDSDPRLGESTCSTDPSVPYGFDSDSAPDRFEGASEPEIDFVRRRQYEPTCDELRNRDIDLLRRHPT